MIIVGIDLGTTNSAIAVWRDGKPELIPDSDGHLLTPSVVALDQATNQWVVGRKAQAIGAGTVIYSIKRLMGRRFQDKFVQEDVLKQHLLYGIKESLSRRGTIEVALADKHLTPQAVSAMILKKLKADAEQYLGHEITQAVITVPAYFHHSQRQATREAGRIAGLSVKRVINEPTAACLAFAYQKLAEPRRKVAVYDLGGGTFDISILEVGRGPFRVRATNGNTRLGGDDLDWLIVKWLLGKLTPEKRQQIKHNWQAKAHLRAAAEEAKIALSTQERVSLKIAAAHLPDFSSDLEVELTREEFKQLASAFMNKTLTPCNQALRDARLQVSQIHEIIMVGGQTRMPAIRSTVAQFFGQEPNISVNPDEVVALGAAVQAAILAGKTKGLKLADVVPLSLGVSTHGKLMDTLIPRNTPVPIAKTKIYSTAHDNQESVEIKIFQGEHPLVNQNFNLGSFILRGIEPALQGEPEIQVTFQIDEDAILHVSACDLHTGNVKEITITDSVRLSNEEIAQLIHDAETHAAEYTHQRRQTEAQLQAEQLKQKLTTRIANKRPPLPDDLIAKIQQTLSTQPIDDWLTHKTTLQKLWQQACHHAVTSKQ